MSPSPSFPIFLPMGKPFSLSMNWTYWPASNEKNMTEVMGCYFWDKITICLWLLYWRFSLPLSCIACSEGSQVPCCEADFGGVHVSKHGCLSSEVWQWPPTWAQKQAFLQLSPVMTIPLADDLVIVLGDPDPEAAQPRFLTYRNCEIINVCSFQWLTLGVICYTAVDN